MQRKLKELLQQKAALKRRILIAENGNDSYCLSSLYRQHQSQMHDLNKQIDALQKASDFSTDKQF